MQSVRIINSNTDYCKNMTLDEKDVSILQLLQQNDRITVKDLSEQVHLSSSPTFGRQKKMEREGIIKRYAAILDYKKAGNGFIVLCQIQLKEQTKECANLFYDAISRLPEVTECYNVSGEFDYVIKIYLRDMSHYEVFVYNHLSVITSISKYKSTFVIAEIKNTNILPVYPSDKEEYNK